MTPTCTTDGRRRSTSFDRASLNGRSSAEPAGIGPCSIHRPGAAAEALEALSRNHCNRATIKRERPRVAGLAFTPTPVIGLSPLLFWIMQEVLWGLQDRWSSSGEASDTDPPPVRVRPFAPPTRFAGGAPSIAPWATSLHHARPTRPPPHHPLPDTLPDPKSRAPPASLYGTDRYDRG